MRKYYCNVLTILAIQQLINYVNDLLLMVTIRGVFRIQLTIVVSLIYRQIFLPKKVNNFQKKNSTLDVCLGSDRPLTMITNRSLKQQKTHLVFFYWRPCIYDAHKEGWGESGQGLNICQVFSDSIIFKQ